MAKAKGKKTEEQEKLEKAPRKKEKQCPTQKQLDEARSAITVAVEGQNVIGDKKEFSSGSVGWNSNGKVVIDGLACQVSCNVIIIGSKDSKK